MPNAGATTPGPPQSLWLPALLMRVRPARLAAALTRALGIRRRRVSTTAGVFEVNPVSILGLQLLRHGEHEPGMAEVLRAVLRPGAVFVDLGANEGYFTVLASALVGAQGRVVAIELQRRLGAILRRHLDLNRATNVTVMPVAVADRSGQADFHLTASTNTGASGLTRATQYALPTEPVQVLTLDQVLHQCGATQVDLLKVDIEGFEYEAILGSPDLFRSGRVRAIALELHPEHLVRRGKDGGAITAFLEGCGYRADSGFDNLVLRWRPEVQREEPHAPWAVPRS